MDLPGSPSPARAVRALAAFVRERLAEVSDTLTPLWNRNESEVARLAGEDHVLAATARQFATVVAGAAAPFAPTPYARARLIRQMHASGLLTAGEAERTRTVLDGMGDGDRLAFDDPPMSAPMSVPVSAPMSARTATGTDSRGVPRPRPRPRR